MDLLIQELADYETWDQAVLLAGSFRQAGRPAVQRAEDFDMDKLKKPPCQL